MTESQIHTVDRAFDFLKINERPAKPRSRGVTEIRGPYYTPMGKHHLQDVLETMGAYVDVLKFAAGSFSLMPRNAVKELLDSTPSRASPPQTPSTPPPALNSPNTFRLPSAPSPFPGNQATSEAPTPLSAATALNP